MLKKIFFSSVFFFIFFTGVVLAQDGVVSENTPIILSERKDKDVLIENKNTANSQETGKDILSAQEDSGFLQYNSPQPTEPIDMKAAIIRACLSLLGVIGLLGVFVFALKFVVNKKDKPFFKERMINILERNYIEPKKTIMLVRVLDRLLVVSVSGDNIRVLTEIKEPEVVDKAVSGDFYGYMKKYTSVEDKKEA